MISFYDTPSFVSSVPGSFHTVPVSPALLSSVPSSSIPYYVPCYVPESLPDLFELDSVPVLKGETMQESITIIDNEDGTYTVEKNYRSVVLTGPQLDSFLVSLNPAVQVNYAESISC